MSTVSQQLLDSSIHFFRWNLERITTCLSELSEDEIWQRPNGSSNSVGNQLLHLSGNIRQWILNGLGGRADVRVRDEEFTTTSGYSKAQLLELLNETIQQSIDLLEGLREADLLPERPVQAYVHDGTFILVHVIEHLSYHTGQIIFWTKLLRDKDLRLYGTEDLNQTN